MRRLLTPTEAIVVDELVRDAPSNKELARRLNKAEPTIKAHMRSILSKMEVPNREKLILLVVTARGVT